MLQPKNLRFSSRTNLIKTRGEHPEFEHKSQKEGIIEPLPSQLKEVCIRYLSVFEEGELDIVQGEWIVKRRNCVATLNNRGSN